MLTHHRRVKSLILLKAGEIGEDWTMNPDFMTVGCDHSSIRTKQCQKLYMKEAGPNNSSYQTVDLEEGQEGQSESC